MPSIDTPSPQRKPRYASFAQWAFLGLVFLASFFISTIAPPFQSPDEFDHVKRAYLLSQGVVILESPDGQPSGGWVDSGLLSYMRQYTDLPLNREAKVSEEKIADAQAIQWTGSKQFSAAPGTGYYFPLVYLPQTVGLAAGQWAGLTVDMSYRLARLTALVSIVLLLAGAMKHLPLPPIVLALFAIPMTLFQLSSASLDGVSTALSVLAISLFARISQEKQQASPRIFYGLTITVFLVASSRAHLLPLVMLLFGSALFTRRSKDVWIAAAITLTLVAWMLFTIKTTVSAKNIGIPTTQVMAHYLGHPTALLEVLANTLGHDYLQAYYARTFMGVLGWLDTPLPETSYPYFYALMVVPLLASIHLKSITHDWQARGLLAACGLSAVFLVFFALLVQWTPHPATLVDGVQGRYFLVPVILLVYALALWPQATVPWRWMDWLSTGVLGLLLLFSIASTSSALIARYYVRAQLPDVIHSGSEVGGHHFGELTPGRVFSQTFTARGRYLYEVKLLLATFARENSGTVQLAIVDGSGKPVFQSDIKVGTIADNAWHRVPTSGVILEKGQNYELRMTSIDGAAGNAVTWWSSTSDVYKDGQSMVDAKLTGRDFAFDLAFLR